jgi:hypothetical protein
LPKQSKPEKTFEILIIEDNPADARLIVDAWQQCDVVNANTRRLFGPRSEEK